MLTSKNRHAIIEIERQGRELIIMEILINGKVVEGDNFAYDGRHDAYVLESLEDELQALRMGLKVYPIASITKAFTDFYGLRAIQNWEHTVSYVSRYDLGKVSFA